MAKWDQIYFVERNPFPLDSFFTGMFLQIIFAQTQEKYWILKTKIIKLIIKTVTQSSEKEKKYSIDVIYFQLIEKIYIFSRISCKSNSGINSRYTCLSAPYRRIHAMMLRKTSNIC